MRTARVRWPSILIGGLGVQVILGSASTPPALLILSMLAITAFLWVNRTRPGFVITLIGLSLNMLVITTNGAMPVSAHAIDEVSLAGVDRFDLRHRVADSDTVLSFLGDVIPLGERVVSIGDVVMLVGLVWFLAATTVSLFQRPAELGSPSRP